MRNFDRKGHNLLYCYVVSVGYTRSDFVDLCSNQIYVIGLDGERKRIGIKLEVALVSAYKRVDDVTAVVIKQALLVVSPSR